MKIREFTLMATVIAAIMLATAVQAGNGTQQKQRDQKRDASCTTATTTGQRDQKRDGSCATATTTATAASQVGVPVQKRLRDGSCLTQ